MFVVLFIDGHCMYTYRPISNNKANGFSAKCGDHYHFLLQMFDDTNIELRLVTVQFLSRCNIF